MNNTPNYPQKVGIDAILKQAFTYWNKTLVYQILFSLIYFSVLIMVAFYFSVKLGILDQYIALAPKLKEGFGAYQLAFQELAETSEFMKFYWILTGTFTFLFPLHLGLFKIYRKMDAGENPQPEDLFAGYSGANFFIYASYYLFWFIIFKYAMILFFPGILWVLATLFTAPLMFFMDKRIFESIELNFKALKKYPVEIAVGCLVAIMFKYFGIITFIGAIFTFPFWTAMIYALYQNIFKEKD